MSDTVYMLTTIDNPYNPFSNYDDWLGFDEDHHYYTNQYLARMTQSSNEISELDAELAIDAAMNKIIDKNVLGLYIKVTKDYEPKVPINSG